LIRIALPWSRSRTVPGVEFVEHESLSGVGLAC
jgi:hypothetical protein